MRIRSTKPEFWRSSRVASVSWDARLVLKGLESFVDDNGVGRHDLALIVGDLFQRDLIREPSRTLARMSEAISELNQAGLLWLYDHDGTDLMYIAFWDAVQRVDKPQPGRFPRPDGTMDYKTSVIREFLASPREPSRTFAPVTGEQGNRGTGEQVVPQLRTEQQKGAASDGRGKALARMRDTNLTARSVDAYQIAEAFSASLPTPIESGVLVKVGTAIDECLKSGIPPSAIANGLRAWTDSDSFAPSQIPSYVHKANNGNRNGKPTAKALRHDEALSELLQEVTTL